MPRGGVSLPARDVETAGDLRGMAERARRWALMLPPGDNGARRLLVFATELDAQADALEVIEVKQPDEAPPIGQR
jgi:hypothetical protein